MPEHSKDDKYWKRRAKNNAAAKRSRDLRREKENSILTRVQFLEGQNQVRTTSPANLLDGFGVSAFFLPQLLIMLTVDFNEI